MYLVSCFSMFEIFVSFMKRKRKQIQFIIIFKCIHSFELQERDYEHCYV